MKFSRYRTIFFLAAGVPLILLCISYVAATLTVVKTVQVAPEIPVVLPATPAYWSFRMTFVGDIMLGRHVEYLAASEGIEYFDTAALFSFYSHDVVVANFESAMANPHIATPSGAMRFSVGRHMLPILTTYGVTHASLANNHTSDYGPTGYDTAVAELAAVGIQTFGRTVGVSSTTVSIVPVTDDHTVALLGFHTLYRDLSDAELMSAFAAASTTDLQIAYVHWGDEYILTHNTVQDTFARRLIALGADVVVGHHPHVTQDIQFVEGVPVFYSLGNFIFDQYFSPEVQEGYAVTFTFTATTTTATLQPYSQCRRSVPCPMDQEREMSYLTGLARRSDAMLAEQIMAKNLTFSTLLLQ